MCVCVCVCVCVPVHVCYWRFRYMYIIVDRGVHFWFYLCFMKTLYFVLPFPTCCLFCPCFIGWLCDRTTSNLLIYFSMFFVIVDLDLASHNILVTEATCCAAYALESINQSFCAYNFLPLFWVHWHKFPTHVISGLSSGLWQRHVWTNQNS